MVVRVLLCSFFFVVVVAIDTRDEEGEAKKKGRKKGRKEAVK